MITNLDIDGFNLYNRAVKHTPLKWLDLRALAETLVPVDDIRRVCYFTALVRPRPNDLHQVERQDAYLRALATLPGLEIHYSEFRERVRKRPLASPRSDLPRVRPHPRHRGKGLQRQPGHPSRGRRIHR